MSEVEVNIGQLLRNVLKHGASDLHLVSRSAPQIRKDGSLVPLNLPVLNGNQIEKMCYSIISEKEKQVLEEEKELDFAVEIPNAGRFRGNYYYTMNTELAAAFRMIPTEIPSLDQLNAPSILKELVKKEKGLVVVTGPTGSGKSTTLSAMVNEINITERKHILTIEDPVEFVHDNKKCLISQRSVGEDTLSFAAALKHALRQDPDIILIGEMRTKETIEIALSAAETGHLVMGTLHTSSAVGTINRIVDTFEGEEQAQIRNILSSSLNAVVAQVLLKRIPKGRIAIQEILINNPAIGNLIREGKLHQVYSQMQLNQAKTGMQTQTQVMVESIEKNLISKESALAYSNNPQELLNKLGS